MRRVIYIDIFLYINTILPFHSYFIDGYWIPEFLATIQTENLKAI